MTEKTMTLGQAIDQIVEALNTLKAEARLTAVKAACSHLDIKIGSSNPVPPTIPGTLPPEPPVPPVTPPTLGMDIRTLKDQKQPKSARQMACVVAYYLRELAPTNDRSDTVTAKDLEKYFKQASFRLPKTIGQILPDAKFAGYFDATSGKGEYSLNAVGYNLVAHNLPTNKGE